MGEFVTKVVCSQCGTALKLGKPKETGFGFMEGIQYYHLAIQPCKVCYGEAGDLNEIVNKKIEELLKQHEATKKREAMGLV